MSVKIRLKEWVLRNGRFARLVVVDERAPRDGGYIEELGYYDPRPRTGSLTTRKRKLDRQVVRMLTDTARALLKKAARSTEG